MKCPILRITTLFAIALIFFTACKDELNTVEGWKDIPVVYGLLSLNDTATYIRIEKAFVDPNKSAFDIAQIPDSLYYKDVKKMSAMANSVVILKIGDFIQCEIYGLVIY